MRKKFQTKFPVARIKRIMQMDEEVGKVAQVTPILISKALEIFMQSLIDESVKETRARESKRLTVGHVKACIHQVSQFDFLKELVEKVQDIQPSAGSDGTGENGGKSNPSPSKKRKKEDSNHGSSSSLEKGKGKRERKEKEPKSESKSAKKQESEEDSEVGSPKERVA